MWDITHSYAIDTADNHLTFAIRHAPQKRLRNPQKSPIYVAENPKHSAKELYLCFWDIADKSRRGWGYTHLDEYCSTVQGWLDWFEVDLGFTELLFIQIDLCVPSWLRVLCHLTGFARLSWGRSNLFAHLPHSEWFVYCRIVLLRHCGQKPFLCDSIPRERERKVWGWKRGSEWAREGEGEEGRRVEERERASEKETGRILGMSHVIHVNVSCHTYKYVMSHMWMCHGTHVNESCKIYEYVMSHICMGHGTHMHGSWHTYEWVMRHRHISHIWTSHGTHTESNHTWEWVMSHIWMSHITHKNESCHT